MKNLVKFALAAATTAALAFTACTSDPCKDIECKNSGTCLDGTCSCPVGYEGKLCDTLSTAKFVGNNLAVADTVTSGPGTGTYAYAMNISTVAGSVTKMTTANLGGFGATNAVDFTLTGPKAITFNYTDLSGRKFEGTGTISTAKKLRLSYTITYSDGTKDVSKATVTLP